MARTFNPLTLSRPKRPVTVRTLTDMQYPDKSVTLALRLMDTLDGARVNERAESLIEKYSDEETDFIVGEEVEEIPAQTWTAAATLEGMQVKQDDADYFSAEEYAAICATLPNLWIQLMAFVGQIQSKGGSVPNV